jgi:hypothetical protein
VYRKILITLAAAGLGVSVAACSSTVPGQGAASEQVAQTAAAGMSAAASRSAAVEPATAPFIGSYGIVASADRAGVRGRADI